MIYAEMLIYIWILGVCNKSKLISKKITHILIGVALIFVAGFRNPYMGMNDMMTGYIPAWHLACNTKLSVIISQYVGNANSGLKDIGFALYLKFLSFFSTNDVFFTVMSVIPYIICICFFIYKYSRNLFLSYFLFFSLNLYTCSFYLLRHISATAMLIIAFDAVLTKKPKTFLFFVIIASMMHSTAIIFVILYPLYHWKIKHIFKRIPKGISTLSMIGICVILSVFGKNLLNSILLTFFSRGRFQTSGGEEGGLGRLLIAVAFLIICLYENRKENSLNVADNNLKKLLMLMSIITCILYAFMPFKADFHRFAKFFEYGNLVFLPNSIMNEKNKINRFTIELILIAIMSIYMFGRLLPGTNALPYSFFWEPLYK